MAKKKTASKGGSTKKRGPKRTTHVVNDKSGTQLPAKAEKG